MDVPKIFAGIPTSYIVAAVVLGVIAALGVMSIMYHPQPVQVQMNQYAPLERYTPDPEPVPNIPTPAPTTTLGRFDPAPAPVVITPDPTATPGNATQSSGLEGAINMGSIMMIALGMLMISFGFFIIDSIMNDINDRYDAYPSTGSGMRTDADAVASAFTLTSFAIIPVLVGLAVCITVAGIRGVCYRD